MILDESKKRPVYIVKNIYSNEFEKKQYSRIQKKTVC